MLFTTYNTARLCNRTQNCLIVQRFDCMNIYNLCTDSFCLQLLCCFQGFPYKVSGCYKADIATFIQDKCLAYFEWHIFCYENRYFWTTETDVNRTVILCRSNCCCHRLIVVAWIQNHHIRQHLHQSQIFQYLVRCSILSQCNAGMRTSYFNIGVRISHCLTYLVVNSSCSKSRKTACKGYLAA